MPVPPLAEQKRIVAKVDELMAMCGELEKHLVLQQDLSSRLAVASTRLAGCGQVGQISQFPPRFPPHAQKPTRGIGFSVLTCNYAARSEGLEPPTF